MYVLYFFLGFPWVQFLIASSMQKQKEKSWEKLSFLILSERLIFSFHECLGLQHLDRHLSLMKALGPSPSISHTVWWAGLG